MTWEQLVLGLIVAGAGYLARHVNIFGTGGGASPVPQMAAPAHPILSALSAMLADFQARQAAPSAAPPPAATTPKT